MKRGCPCWLPAEETVSQVTAYETAPRLWTASTRSPAATGSGRRWSISGSP